MHIRELDPTDWAKMTRLRFMQHTHAGARLEELTSQPIMTVSDKYQWRPHFALGAFNGLQLLAFICCHVADDYWVLDLMVSNDDPRVLRDVLQACLERAEQLGIYSFYYAFPKKWARAYRSFWKEGSALLKRYVIEDVAEIEPYKVPADRWVWDNVLYNVIVGCKLLVRRSSVAQR